MLLKSVTHHSALALVAAATLFSSTASAEVYELRTYTTNEGKLDNLHARFRDHTIRIFKRHGMESVGYWTPTEEPESKNTLIYVLRHESREAATASWRAFLSDPEWQKVARESQLDGQILAKAPESVYMEAADFSPEFSADDATDDTVFELRVYRTNEGKLDNLNARFRDHTIRIFNRFGMQSVAYWHPTDEPDSKDTLIYILRYKSRDAAMIGWKGFGGDEEWQKVARESQLDGRILRAAPASTYMKATDYSAMK